MRDASFDWLANGFTHQEIAAARKVSVAVVRRDIARAIRARQIETRDGHAQLQIARLTRGLAVVAHRIERGDMAAVGPLVKLVTALDRYHGPGRRASGRNPPGARQSPGALPAPPLAIAHVAAPKAQDAAPDAGDRSAAAFAERLGWAPPGAPRPCAGARFAACRRRVPRTEGGSDTPDSAPLSSSR